MFNLCFNAKKGKPRAEILFRKGTEYTPLPNYSRKDQATAMGWLQTITDDLTVVFSSAYLPCEANQPDTHNC